MSGVIRELLELLDWSKGALHGLGCIKMLRVMWLGAKLVQLLRRKE